MMSNITPFDAFPPVNKILAIVGFFKMFKKPINRYKRICHQIFRVFSFFMVILYIVQHIVYVAQVKDIKKVLEGLVVTIPLQNIIPKFLALNLNASRIDKLNTILAGPTFAPREVKDREILMKINRYMNLLLKLLMVIATFGTTLLPVSNMLQRMNDGSYEVLCYFPFKADTWTKFTLTVILETIPLFWAGYGHLALDCLIATYFAQTIAQLNVIKCNLKSIFDAYDDIATGATYHYRDAVDNSVHKRFVYYVTRYENVMWYTREVYDIFDGAVTFQFLTSSISICLVVYQMSTIPLSVVFMFFSILLMVFLTQIGLHCFIGGLIKYESQSIVESVYMSDWVSLSPKFRRLLLIAMLRWSRPIQPKAFAVVPLSLDTFLSIVKFAYTLYTVLSNQK